MPIYKMDGKKDGLQKYRVRINYVDSNANAKQIDRVAYGSAAAKELELKLQQELKERKLPSNITIKQLFLEYIEYLKPRVRESTLTSKLYIFKFHILGILGNYKISKLTAPVLQKWKTSIEEKTLVLSTKKNIYATLHSMLNYAVKMDYLPKNPLNTIGNFKNPYDFEKPQDKQQYYTAEQFLKYISAARAYAAEANVLSRWSCYVFFCIAFYTGMRKGEINAIEWTDMVGKFFHVCRSVQLKRGRVIETPPKNKASDRVLQIPEPLLKILEEHKRRQMQDPNFTESYRICGGSTCLSDSFLLNKNALFAKNAGLKKIRIHDFRHTHVSLLVNCGQINIQEIARRLGHSNIETTWNVYSHLYPHEEERAVEILDKIV